MLHSDLLTISLTPLAAFFGASLSSWVALKASKQSRIGTVRQMRLQRAIEIAKFRQAWINDLRDAMAGFQALGVTPDLDHSLERDFYRLGTKIELLMNRDDSNYEELQSCLYDFLRARTRDEKYSCNTRYIRACQNILRKEWRVLKSDLAQATPDDE